jgi:predicted dehydrogenase
VVALVDLSEQAMKRLDDHFSGNNDYRPEHFTDAQAMLGKSKPDVVSVGVWDKDHAPMTIAAAAAGAKAVLCEKPMADSVGAAVNMLKACQRAGVRLAIGHQRRFLPAWTLAKQMIADGEIGDARLIASFARDGLPNYASHQADMFRYLLSDAECEWVMGNVERETDQWARAVRIEDKALAVFGFENGAQAMILSGLTPKHGFGARIYGSDGMMEVTIADVKVMNGKTGGWRQHRPDGDFVKHVDAKSEFLEASTAQARELADWVSGTIPDHRGNGTNGYKAFEMVHAVYESARTHTQVYLPLKTMASPLELMIESGHLPVRYPGKYDIRART